MRYLVDTNIFLRLLTEDTGKAHEDSKKLLTASKNNKLSVVTSSVVLAEVNWVLKSFYKIKKVDRLNSLTYIKNLPNLLINDDYRFPLALEMYRNFNIKFIDCMIASIPKILSKEWAIVSYDKDFDKLPVIRKEPKDLLG